MTLKQLKAFGPCAYTQLCQCFFRVTSQPICFKSYHQKLRGKELGGKLFNRNTRRVELTQEGKSLIPYAKKLLANWDGKWKTMLNNALNSIVEH